MATQSVTPSSRESVTGKGKLLSLIRVPDGWMAVVAAFTSDPGDPVLSHIVPVSELKGPAKRKAERWLTWLS